MAGKCEPHTKQGDYAGEEYAYEKHPAADTFISHEGVEHCVSTFTVACLHLLFGP